MSKVLDHALEELKALPEDAQDAIARDLLEMIRSERKWDELYRRAKGPTCVFFVMAAEAATQASFSSAQVGNQGSI
jgi:hypothetical protein